MNRFKSILNIRQKLQSGGYSIGSWMQIPHSSIAEIMGQSGYDWVAIDLEHGAIGVHQLPDLFRALELGGTLPLVRLAHGHPKDCKQALDAGAGGVIVPMVENSKQLRMVRDACRWPPSGKRGVAFSRANLFGKNFSSYADNEAQQPLLIAMIENMEAVNNLESILQVKGVDAILIGPYDLSASMGYTAQFEKSQFKDTIDYIYNLSTKYSVACGLHIVKPEREVLQRRISDGYKFIAYSLDSVFMTQSFENPESF